MSSKYHAIFLALTVPVIAACSPAQNDTSVAPRPTFVQTLEVSQSDGYDSVSSYSGRVEAALDSSLGFEVAGLVTDVAAEEGDVVARGDVLAKLDTARLDAQRAEALAALAQIEAELSLANATLERVADAFTYKGVSRQQLDEAEQRVSALTASRDVAAANVERIDVDIRKSALVAAFDGSITRRFTDPGAVVSAGTPIVQLQSSAQLEARIGVAPAAARNLQVGEHYELTVDGRAVPSRLRAVISQRDAQTRTVDALFAITNEDGFVRSGDTAELETRIWNDTPGFWLPLSSLVEGQRGLWRALVADSSGDSDFVLKGHTLEVLYADSQKAFVRGTLKDGDRLVSDGIQRVVEGQLVSIDDSDAPSRVAVAGDQDVN